MARKSTVTVHLLAKTKEFQKSMKRLGDVTGINKLRGGIKNISNQMLQMSKYAATAGTALAGVAVKAAADLEQSTGAVKDVFKQYAATVEAYAKKASTSVGLSGNAYNELAILIGTQLKNGGTAIDQIAGKTDNLIRLGADLAAGFGGTTAEAVAALSSALKGERDPIERYGVSLNQARIDAEAAALGFTKVGGALSAEATQAATLSLIMKQTSDFHGKFAAENTTLAHQLQVVKAKLQDMAATFGQILLPIITQVVTWVNDHLTPAFAAFMAWLADNAIPKIKEFAGYFTQNLLPALQNLAGYITATIIPAISGFTGYLVENKNTLIPLAAGIASALTAWRAYNQAVKIAAASTAAINGLKGVIIAWKAATEGMTIAQRVLNLVMKANPIGIIISAITALVGVITTLWYTNENFRNALIGIWEQIKATFATAISFISSLIAGFNASIQSIGTFFINLGTTIVSTWQQIQATCQAFTSAVLGIIGGWINKVVSFFASLPAKVISAVGKMAQGVQNAFNAVVSFFASVPSRILSAMGNLGNLLWNAGKSIIDGFLNGIKSMFGFVKDTLGTLTSWLPDWKGPAALDKKILRKSGQLVIGGFIDGLEDKYSSVHKSLKNLTDSLSHSVSIPQIDTNIFTPHPAQAGAVYQINISALTPSPEIGRQVVAAIRAYEMAGGRK